MKKARRFKSKKLFEPLVEKIIHIVYLCKLTIPFIGVKSLHMRKL